MGLPNEGSVEPGTIQRIERYGAFCQLTRFPHVRGLIHISQLTNTRVENVEDVVSLNDEVWVKVLELFDTSTSTTTGTSGTTGPSPRLKVKLSMKDVAQDGSGVDLAAEEQRKAMVAATMESNLNSTIGMGIARDPMENFAMQQQSQQRLKLKHTGLGMTSPSSKINGYALVGDTEGEPEPSVLDKPSVTTSVAAVAPNATRLPPVGRGRGATLPAWMTQQQQNQNGPTGSTSNEEIENDNHHSKSDHKRKRKSKDKSYRKAKKEKRKKGEKARSSWRRYSDDSDSISADYDSYGKDDGKYDDYDKDEDEGDDKKRMDKESRSDHRHDRRKSSRRPHDHHRRVHDRDRHRRRRKDNSKQGRKRRRRLGLI